VVIEQKITTKKWTHADFQYHSPVIRDKLKRQGYLPDTTKFADIREYPTTNTIEPPTKERKIMKAAQTPESSTTFKMLDVHHQEEKKEFEDECDEYVKETEVFISLRIPTPGSLSVPRNRLSQPLS
jgi:hypothetical protein